MGFLATWARTPVGKGLLVGFVLGLLAWGGVFSGWERRAYDARTYFCALFGAYFGGRRVEPPVVVVGIDDRALAEYGRWPWPRDLLALLVQSVVSEGAAVVGLDVIVAEPAPGDEVLAAALPAGRAVLPVYGEGSDRVGPVPALAARASVGHIEVNVDRDGVVRSVPAERDGALPLGIAAARLWQAAHGQVGPADHQQQGAIWINLRPRAGARRLTADALIRTVSAAELMAGALASNRSSAATTGGRLQGDVVFIGLTGSGAAGIDAHATALRPLGAIPGVYLHAALATAELTGQHIRRPAGWWTLVLTMVAGWAAGLSLLSARAGGGALAWLWPAPVLAVYAVAVYVAQARYALWLPWVGPALALVITSGWMGAEHYIGREQERRALRRLFARYVPPALLPELVRRRGELGLAGVNRHVAVLFADVRGFTSLVEPLPPARVMQVVSMYLEALAAVVRRHGGMVDKYLGDGLMAVFGAPVPCEEPAVLAVECALAMQEAVTRLSPPDGLQQLPGIGIGVHWGEAILGTVGGQERLEYTAMGDTVNVAARLEELAEAGTVVVSAEVMAQLPEAHPARGLVLESREVQLRGRQQAVTICVLAPGPARTGANCHAEL